MSAHDHAEHVPGCFRCESADWLADGLCDALMAARGVRYDGLTVDRHLENLIERVLALVDPPAPAEPRDSDPATRETTAPMSDVERLTLILAAADGQDWGSLDDAPSRAQFMGYPDMARAVLASDWYADLRARLAGEGVRIAVEHEPFLRGSGPGRQKR